MARNVLTSRRSLVAALVVLSLAQAASARAAAVTRVAVALPTKGGIDLSLYQVKAGGHPTSPRLTVSQSLPAGFVAVGLLRRVSPPHARVATYQGAIATFAGTKGRRANPPRIAVLKLSRWLKLARTGPRDIVRDEPAGASVHDRYVLATGRETKALAVTPALAHANSILASLRLMNAHATYQPFAWSRAGQLAGSAPHRLLEEQVLGDSERAAINDVHNDVAERASLRALHAKLATLFPGFNLDDGLASASQPGTNGAQPVGDDNAPAAGPGGVGPAAGTPAQSVPPAPADAPPSCSGFNGQETSTLGQPPGTITITFTCSFGGGIIYSGVNSPLTVNLTAPGANLGGKDYTVLNAAGEPIADGNSNGNFSCAPAGSTPPAATGGQSGTTGPSGPSSSGLGSSITCSATLFEGSWTLTLSNLSADGSAPASACNLPLGISIGYVPNLLPGNPPTVIGANGAIPATCLG